MIFWGRNYPVWSKNSENVSKGTVAESGGIKKKSREMKMDFEGIEKKSRET